MPTRTFQLASVKIRKMGDLDSAFYLSNIINKTADHVDSEKYKCFKYSKDDSTYVLKLKEFPNTKVIHGIIFRSSENINGYTFDNLTFSDKTIDAKLEDDEVFTTAFRFVIIQKDLDPDDVIVYEKVRTPKFDDILPLVQRVFNESNLEFLIAPKIRLERFNEINAIGVSWEYSFVESQRIGTIWYEGDYTYRAQSTGKISTRKKLDISGMLNIKKNHDKYTITNNKNPQQTQDVQIQEGLKITAEAKRNGLKVYYSLQDLTITIKKDFLKEDIQDHTKVFKELKDFYTKRADYN